MLRLLVLTLAAGATMAAPAPRAVLVDGQRFVLAKTNSTIVMSGPNVVVKGPPYLPSVDGTEACADVVDAACTASGNCTTCTTFNEADVANIKAHGWNAIRLGVVWAGAQPSDTNSLDPDFLARLDAILTLCDNEGIAVVLDNHGDMTGSAGCGNGVPLWYHEAAAEAKGVELGKPLVTDFPFYLVPGLDVEEIGGYDVCGDNVTKWAAHANDPNYNLLNECCMAMNSGGNPGALGWTSVAQAAMDYLVEEGEGRDYFVRFWRLMAEAVADHPSAIAAELMNEPMTIRRREYYETWRAVAEVINGVVPDLAVAIVDVGEGAVLPSFVTDHGGAGLDIAPETVAWIKASNTVFYAWHYYGEPSSAHAAVRNVQALSAAWNVPSFATEFGGCDTWDAASAASISHTYWHYSSYCNTGSSFGNLSVPEETFGACILGWASGDSQWECG